MVALLLPQERCLMTVRERKGKVRIILTAALTAIAIPAMTATTVLPALAQAPAAAHDGQGGFHGRAAHVEGRIAYLKAELKITDAQAQAWNGVASAMRQAAEADRALAEEMHSRQGKPMTAVEHLALRDKATALRANNSKAFTTAFTALYARMSDDQKKAADQLLSPRHRHRA
jgi:hypothetical protein